MKHSVCTAAFSLPMMLAALAAAQAPGPVVPAAPASKPDTTTLEMRIVASKDYWAAGVAFDMVREAGRLTLWLDQKDNRDRVLADPRKVAGFNDLGPARGGPLNPKLKWYPRVIAPRQAEPKKWQRPYSHTEGSPVVPLFTKAQHEAGPGAGKGQLVELFPINMNEGAFTARDLDPDKIVAGVDNGQPVLRYEIVEARVEDYRKWTARNRKRSCAIIIGGMVRTAPVFTGAIAGKGAINGSFTKAEIETLARALKVAARSPAPPTGDTALDLGQGGGALPAGSDPEDLRAMQGAEEMLRAERRLREMIKAGKITGVDRILSFEEISAWPYEDGLLGIPKQVKKLDSKQVLMTGFMLPIDEVENIKEFLLVQSLWSCCYGQPPDINGIVRVVMKGKARLDYQFDPIKVVGTFKVKAVHEDGYCVDIFQLHADSVSVIR